jgi:hypothetical protein
MKKNWLYIPSTGVTVLLSLITGIGNLIPFSHIESDLAHLGYPGYFRFILGTWKVIAAIVIAVPGWVWFKDLAYMGVLLELSGAAISRMAVGDGAGKIMLPLLLAGVVGVSWRSFRMRAAE